jgi:hypothetical protein
MADAASATTPGHLDRGLVGAGNANGTKAGAPQRSTFATSSSRLDGRVYNLQLSKLGKTFLSELYADT